MCLCGPACSFSKQTKSMCHNVPMLKVEEWPLPGELLTDETVLALIERVGDVCFSRSAISTTLTCNQSIEL